jgi:hypothetical protein
MLSVYQKPDDSRKSPCEDDIRKNFPHINKFGASKLYLIN